MDHPGEIICHPGIINKVDAQSVYVKILSSSACTSCQVKGACQLFDTAEKIIEVRKNPAITYPLGKPVDVVMERTSGTKAVLLAYLIPFCLVVTTLFILIGSGLNEGLSALIALAILAPYYFVLSLFKERLKRDLAFTIHFK